jgi:hypothetical protein
MLTDAEGGAKAQEMTPMERLANQVENLKYKLANASMCELAAGNANLVSFMDEWTNRAAKAEADRRAMAERIAAETAAYELIVGWAKQAGVDTDHLEGATMIERANDAEQARWQRRIDDIVVRIDPDRDGSGCDSGDPLDLTDTELRGAVNKLQERIAGMERVVEAAKAFQKAEAWYMQVEHSEVPRDEDQSREAGEDREWKKQLLFNALSALKGGGDE